MQWSRPQELCLDLKALHEMRSGHFSLSATYSMQKQQKGQKPFDPVQSGHLEQRATNLLNAHQ